MRANERKSASGYRARARRRFADVSGTARRAMSVAVSFSGPTPGLLLLLMVVVEGPVWAVAVDADSGEGGGRAACRWMRILGRGGSDASAGEEGAGGAFTETV